MAKKREKSKKSGGRFLTLIAAFIIGLIAAHFTGIFTLDDWKEIFEITSSVSAEGEVQVRFIDVGQGDSELILSDGHAVLIDTGERENGEKICAYLKSVGVTKLDGLVISHPHSDHMGAASYILDNVETEKVIIPKLPDDMTPNTVTYEKFLESVQKSGLKLTRAEPGLKISIGDGELEIISPVSDDYDNLNNFSAAAVLRHGENSFLFMGDCEKAAEEDIIESGNLEHTDVLKAGHHGSSSSSSKEFLEIVTPEYAVISCGEGNSYGHPNKKAVDRIKEYTNEIYRTDIDGTVTFISNEKGLTVETEN